MCFPVPLLLKVLECLTKSIHHNLIICCKLQILVGVGVNVIIINIINV